MEYQMKGNRCAVVVVEEGISEKEAKQEALKAAAEMTVNQGYEYFVVEGEKEVVVVKAGDSRLEDSERPRNIYYELIQSNNFGREPLNSADPYLAKAYLGWRMEFSMHHDPVKGAVDAHQYSSKSSQ